MTHFVDAPGPAKTFGVTTVAGTGFFPVTRMHQKPLEKGFRRPTLKLMRVTLYRVEDELGLLSLPRHGESAYGLLLRCLECRSILSTNEELAAAMAYRQAVSIHRLKRLKALRAPKIITESEVKLHAIVERLLPIGLLHGTTLFAINNYCECWLLCVDAITDSLESDKERTDAE